jgi:hypothetical protein
MPISLMNLEEPATQKEWRSFKKLMPKSMVMEP